jgi:hypothetical protein
LDLQIRGGIIVKPDCDRAADASAASSGERRAKNDGAKKTRFGEE